VYQAPVVDVVGADLRAARRKLLGKHLAGANAFTVRS
jgi:hypothetical protein